MARALDQGKTIGGTVMALILLWLLGMPLGIIILLWLIGFGH
jgi:hypothetical protein